MFRGFSESSVRAYLGCIWIMSFASVLLAVCLMYFLGWIRVATFSEQLETIVKLYTPYIGVVIAYYLAARNTRRESHKVDRTAFLALLTSVVWNVPIVLLVVRHLRPTLCDPGENCLADSMTLVAKTGQYLSFLVAPSLGLYFGKKL